MNEKYEEPTIEQLRALLSGHPYLLKHVKTEKSIDRASREKLMELMDLCGLSIDQVDKSDPFGLLRGLKNKPGKDKTAGRSGINRLSQGHKEGPTYGQDADFVPFQITIEALGHKMHYSAFFAYEVSGSIKKNKAGDDWDLEEYTCDSTIKILSYTDIPEPGHHNSRRSMKKSSPMDEIRPVILDDPSIAELLPDAAYCQIMGQVEDDLLGQIISEVEHPELHAARESRTNDKPENKKE